MNAGERNAGERMNKNVERGRATRAHVIEVATRLFAEHGYDGTSIETVQASAGVSRGSLYHHFPGKEALFWAVLEEVGARIAMLYVRIYARGFRPAVSLPTSGTTRGPQTLERLDAALTNFLQEVRLVA